MVDEQDYLLLEKAWGFVDDLSDLSDLSGLFICEVL